PPQAARGGRGGDGRQVPGPAGSGRLLLDGELERRRRPARARLPLLAQPPQRRDLARAVPRVSRREPAAARCELPDDRADAPREFTLPLRRAFELKSVPGRAPWTDVVTVVWSLGRQLPKEARAS